MSETGANKQLALLIPGLDGTGRLYYRQFDALSTRYRVCAWEFQKRADFDIPDLVSELAEGTAGEDPGSILVVGESFGGPVAIQYVLTFPERVRKLVLINTFPAYARRIRIRLACKLVPLIGVGAIRAMKDYIVDRTLRLEGVAPEDRARYQQIIRLVHAPAYRRRLELVREVALRDRLPEIAVPTDIFASGRDKIVPSVKEGRYMARRIPRARLHIVPHAGHALLLTPGFSLAEYV